MRTAQNDPASRHGRGERRSRWMLATAGLTLLVVSIVMMVNGAEPSRAQAVSPHQTLSLLVRGDLPRVTGPVVIDPLPSPGG